MATLMTKLSHRFTMNGAALSGYTVAVTKSGGNDPARLFADAAGNLRFPNNRLVTDADGNLSCYVAAGAYRLSLLTAGNQVFATVDPVIPGVEGVRLDAVSSVPVNTVPYAAAITPSINADVTVLDVAAMTGALTINAPAGTIANQAGKILVVQLLQDATGGRAATWNSVFVKAADAAGTANQRGATIFVCDGTKWNQLGGALTYR